MEPEVKFIEDIVKQLVDMPEEVKIERTVDEKGVLLILTVHDSDLGKVIGKSGSTVNAMRSLLRVFGAKHDGRYALKVDDPKNFGDNDNHHQSDSQSSYEPAENNIAALDEVEDISTDIS